MQLCLLVMAVLEMAAVLWLWLLAVVWVWVAVAVPGLLRESTRWGSSSSSRLTTWTLGLFVEPFGLPHLGLGWHLNYLLLHLLNYLLRNFLS
ncbi:hypothetical protein N9L68_08735 [bacterium]|nr:hypothetical protein [bacterium]